MLLKMVLIDFGSFELGCIFSDLVNLISFDKATKPSILLELSALERRCEQLEEDVRSNIISDRYELSLKIQEIFRDHQSLRESFRSEQ